MKLRPFARFFSDRIYRTNYLAICCARPALMHHARRLVRTTNLTRDDREGLLRALAASIDYDANCNGQCFRLNPTDAAGNTVAFSVLWFRPGVDVSVVTHEAWHALFWTFRDRGVRFDAGDGADEPVAYYLQWIVRSVLGITY